MTNVSVRFRYLTGLKRKIFRDARLLGSWDERGRWSPTWSETPMIDIVAEDGCPGFGITVKFDASEVGKHFQWAVRLNTPAVADVSGIPTEVNDANQTDRVRSFQLAPAAQLAQVEEYFFTCARRLGARKVFAHGRSGKPGLRFSVWAPNAQQVEVVFGDPARGYIADDGDGIDLSRPSLPMAKGTDGIWQTEVVGDFAAHEGLPYMYRIRNAEGRTVYRTDLFSRQQIGSGTRNPGGGHWDGGPDQLDGTKSCSLIVGSDTVAQDFVVPSGHSAVRISESNFWAHEFTPGLAVPSRIEDLVIYELHVGALGFGRERPGNLEDAMALLPHLSDLGVNAVELLPMSEFSGVGWGYGDTHHFVVESSAGTRDQYKHFIRECHRRGIAVLQDVVYNHFDPDADRAEWAYDSDAPEQNIYYWYEGQSSDYAASDGGYLDNGSTGYAPRYWEEMVRQLFVSSAAAFIEEFHVDGLRVDLTQAMHRDNALHADGRSIGSANQFGAKLLREWSRTLRLIKPTAMLIAEDHTGWDKVTQLPETGGLGFDATWYAAFYHNLIGDSDSAGGRARLLKMAGLGDERGLDIAQFADGLYQSKYSKIVYHESHDEAGNSSGSVRTLVCGANGAALVGLTRAYAEARARVAFGLSLFSAGTPMFFMAEEIGAQKPYRYDSFMANREDIAAERAQNGARLFRFYQDAIRFSRRHPAVRVQAIDIVHVNGDGRVIAFRRSAGNDELLIVASLSNQIFETYVIQTDAWRLPDGGWSELFNSDASIYGGNNTGNFGATLFAASGRIQIRIPANGLVVFVRT
ncbi:MAG TPA: alpha-amylase family glycosyl hydrolase [Thiobacillaceae bacterium]|nr:alpha-amylase family glycosyl hydrolase [Thiobacillaceae bacterium]